MVKAGDQIVVESEKVGAPPRRGEVVEVSGTMISVNWDTGGRSTFVPSAGSLQVVEPET